MKFLCGNCKAKYQIADEKISGRTLRMKCRKCSHDIIIRGESMVEEPEPAPRPAAPRAPASPSRRAPTPRAPAPRPRALGADFRRSVASSAQQQVPAPPPPVEQLWHVAINDVPVGPIRKDEVARKISTGAVNKDSLAWREGFDDWRPLAEIPELSALLRRPPPAPNRPAQVGRGIGARSGSRPRIRPMAPRSSPSSAPGPRASEPARPAARSNVVPIGGRLGASAAPAIDDEDIEPTQIAEPIFDELLAPPAAAAPRPAASLSQIPAASTEPRGDTDDELLIAGLGGGAAVASAPAAISAEASGAMHPMPSYAPRRRGLPVGAWIAIAGAIAFGAVLAVMVGTKLLLEDSAQQQLADATATNPETEVVEPELVTDVEEPVAEGEPDEEIVEPQAEGEPTSMRGGTSMRTATGAATAMKQLSAAERALLERFGMESGSSIADINTGDGVGSGMNTTTRRPLTEQQLATVVNRNRPSLRRCYETAVRGMSEAPSVRLDVEVTVGSSGVVTNVTARGQDVGQLKSCVMSAVRRWTFPSSGASSRVGFPVVFTSAS